MSDIKNHDLYRRMMNDYIDGVLDPASEKHLNGHLSECEECRDYLDSLLKLQSFMEQLPDEIEVPQEAHDAWVSAIKEESAYEESHIKRSSLRIRLSAIAAAIVILFAATAVMRSDPFSVLNMKSTENSNAVYSVSGGRSYSASSKGMSDMGANYAAAPASAAMMMYSDGAEEEVIDYEEAYADTDAAYEADEAISEAAREKVIIRTAGRVLESATFDQTLESIEGLVDDFDGRIEDMDVRGKSTADGGSGRHASLTARVPQGSLDSFLTSLDSLAHVNSRTEKSEDVSEAYYDTQGRLESYRVQAERLRELLAEAEDVSDILIIEDKLSEVEYQIDSYERSLRSVKSRSDESAVTIDLIEQAVYEQSEAGIGSRLGSAFRSGIEGLGEFLRDALIVLVSALPALIIIAVIAVVAVIIIRRRRRR